MLKMILSSMNTMEMTKIELQISLFPEGMGLQSICEFENDEQSDIENDDNTLTYQGSSQDDLDDDSDGEVPGTITLITGKTGNEHLNLIAAYFNGIRSEVMVDTGAGASIIHHADNPKRDRIFKIKDRRSYYLPYQYDVNWREMHDSIAPAINNKPEYDELFWSSDDEDEDEDNMNRSSDNEEV